MHCSSQWDSGRFVYKDSMFGPGESFLLKSLFAFTRGLLHTFTAVMDCSWVFQSCLDIPDLILISEPVQGAC